MNRVSPELFIALRYLNTQRKGLFTLLTTFIGVSGVALGVGALIVTLAVMNGFQTDIKKKLLDAQAHIMIYGNLNKSAYEDVSRKLSSVSGVKAFSPFFMGQAILSAGDRTSGVVVKGITSSEFSVNNLKKSLKAGDWDRIISGKGGIILGEELANNLGLWIGDSVVLVSPKIDESAFGIIPKMKKFKVAGLVNTGYYEFDASFAYCSLSDAQEFFGLAGYATGVSAALDNPDKIFESEQAIKKALGGYYPVKTYAEMNKNLFSALKLEKFMMSLILALIIIVATFTIASNLLMTSVEKIKDIGIMRAMGAGPSFIKKVFFYEGILIALLGIFFGFVLGLSVSWFIKTHEIIKLPSDIYYITKVPVEINGLDLLWTAGVSFILCVLAAIFPAIRASKINPIDAIRYG
ncbi:MAG: lipoprotein-releasing ABC transporter permease subunit [Elusimicrobiota bacterium]